MQHNIKNKLMDLSENELLSHRDISWLAFNYRVLQEAKSPSVPLFEKIKFLAIYSSNLDEFFKIRVANHRNLLRVGKKTIRKLADDPKKILKEILEIVNTQQEEFSDIFYVHIKKGLKKQNIYIKRPNELNEEQLRFIENYFSAYMLPYVQPVLLKGNKIRPFLNNGALYQMVWMEDKSKEGKEEYAFVKVPSDHLPRHIELPSTGNRKDIIILDNIVRYSIPNLFPGYHIKDTFSFKLNRDAELYIDDEFSGNLIHKIRSSLNKRNIGPASRFVYDRSMPADLLSFIQDTFDLDKYDLFPEGRYHNNSDFFSFPNFGLKSLMNADLPPLSYPPLETSEGFFDRIKERDHLITFPYQSYESVVRFFENAAEDKKVTHIKIIQYRVARKSRIMNALMKAVKNGKQVSAFIEVKARFDEAANLKWGERLEAAGINVYYSFPGVKVHSKLALVLRNEDNKSVIYSYLSTGNFHEDTSKIYSDYGLFTADKRLTAEIARVFTFLETVKMPDQDFEHLLVGQFNLRGDLVELIEKEIENAKEGKKASMILKMNSLQDIKIIKKLYEASAAGVKIKMIIRGICCLKPQVPGLSENIEAYSIVDRFLEHARVFIFHNEGDEKMYLSSADWMTRNLNYRIETTFPIYDKKIKKTIKDHINLQLEDNVKSRIIDADNNNYFRNTKRDIAIRSQVETYFYTKRQDYDE